MNVNFKIIVFVFISVILYSCNNNKLKLEDGTVVIKKKIELKKYEVGFYSKAYSYHWVKDKDTLDFSINIYERQKDSTSTISLMNKKPMLFETVLSKTKECIPMIKEDFNTSKITNLYFNTPIHFSDLSNELSAEYQKQYGEIKIDEETMNNFLQKSSLNTKLSKLLLPLDKKIKRYTFNKFSLIKKEDYKAYLPEIDVNQYPEFTFNGIGIHVWLADVQKSE